MGAVASTAGDCEGAREKEPETNYYSQVKHFYRQKVNGYTNIHP